VVAEFSVTDRLIVGLLQSKISGLAVILGVKGRVLLITAKVEVDFLFGQSVYVNAQVYIPTVLT
jgi:hypothetical protein